MRFERELGSFLNLSPEQISHRLGRARVTVVVFADLGESTNGIYMFERIQWVAHRVVYSESERFEHRTIDEPPKWANQNAGLAPPLQVLKRISFSKS